MPPRTRKDDKDEQTAAPPPAPAPAPAPDPPQPPPPADPLEPSVEQAAAARRSAMDGVTDADRGMVDALLAERRGYLQRGMNDRVGQVDEQLRLRGYHDE